MNVRRRPCTVANVPSPVSTVARVPSPGSPEGPRQGPGATGRHSQVWGDTTSFMCEYWWVSVQPMVSVTATSRETPESSDLRYRIIGIYIKTRSGLATPARRSRDGRKPERAAALRHRSLADLFLSLPLVPTRRGRRTGPGRRAGDVTR